jgi:hypothetical protein
MFDVPSLGNQDVDLGQVRGWRVHLTDACGEVRGRGSDPCSPEEEDTLHLDSQSDFPCMTSADFGVRGT